jgi:hypothetical protein
LVIYRSFMRRFIEVRTIPPSTERVRGKAERNWPGIGQY